MAVTDMANTFNAYINIPSLMKSVILLNKSVQITEVVLKISKTGFNRLSHIEC